MAEWAPTLLIYIFVWVAFYDDGDEEGKEKAGEEEEEEEEYLYKLEELKIHWQ